VSCLVILTAAVCETSCSYGDKRQWKSYPATAVSMCNDQLWQPWTSEVKLQEWTLTEDEKQMAWTLQDCTMTMSTHEISSIIVNSCNFSHVVWTGLCMCERKSVTCIVKLGLIKHLNNHAVITAESLAANLDWK